MRHPVFEGVCPQYPLMGDFYQPRESKGGDLNW